MISNRCRSILLILCAMVLSAVSFGEIGISVTFGPPALPVYEQPLCPGDGYFWTPGYWAYDGDDYFWVPGTWVLPPEPGLYWTPGYWAWSGEAFTFYDGFWATQVGFYGGINYGFGYFGEGYQGGRWDNGRFFYNRTVNNVNVTQVHNVYNTTVINNNTTVTRVSYNGGNGGISARPRPEEEAVARERHIPPVPVQQQHFQAARSNPELRASTNRGKPRVAATPRPGDLRSGVPAKQAGAPYNPQRNQNTTQSQPNRQAERPDNRSSQPNQIAHASDIPHGARPEPPNTGDSKQDRKYQQQQEKLQAKQDQEQQKLQRKQEEDHQRVAKQNADEARKQQLEQQHQQQTRQMQQKHEQQQQRLQQRMPPSPEKSVRPNNPGEKHDDKHGG